MVSDRLTKSMIDVQKSTIEMVLSTLSTVEQQSGRATVSFLDQMAGLPREGLKSMNRWMDSMKTANDELGSMMRDGYEQWSDIFAPTIRHTGQAAQQSRQTAREYGRREDGEMEQKSDTGKQPASEDALEELKEQIEERRL